MTDVPSKHNDDPATGGDNDTASGEVEPKYGYEWCENCGDRIPVTLMPHGIRPNLCRDCERAGA